MNRTIKLIRKSALLLAGVPIITSGAILNFAQIAEAREVDETGYETKRQTAQKAGVKVNVSKKTVDVKNSEEAQNLIDAEERKLDEAIQAQKDVEAYKQYAAQAKNTEGLNVKETKVPYKVASAAEFQKLNNKEINKLQEGMKATEYLPAYKQEIQKAENTADLTVKKNKKTIDVTSADEVKTLFQTEINKLKEGEEAAKEISTYKSQLNTAKNTEGLIVNETNKVYEVTSAKDAKAAITAEVNKLKEGVEAAKTLPTYKAQVNTAKNTANLTVKETDKILDVESAAQAKAAITAEVNKLKEGVEAASAMGPYLTALNNAKKAAGLTVNETKKTIEVTDADAVKAQIATELNKLNDGIEASSELSDYTAKLKSAKATAGLTVNETPANIKVTDLDAVKAKINTEIAKLNEATEAVKTLATYTSKLNTAKNTTGLTVKETAGVIKVTNADAAKAKINAEIDKLNAGIDTAKTLASYTTKLNTAKNTTGLTVKETNKTITVTDADDAKAKITAEINKLNEGIKATENLAEYKAALATAKKTSGLTVNETKEVVDVTNGTTIKNLIQSQINKLNEGVDAASALPAYNSKLNTAKKTTGLTVNETAKTIDVTNATTVKNLIATDSAKLDAGIDAAKTLTTYTTKLNTAKNTAGVVVAETAKTITVTDANDAKAKINAEISKLNEATEAAKTLATYTSKLNTAKNTAGLTVSETAKTITVTDADTAKEFINAEIAKLNNGISAAATLATYKTQLQTAENTSGLTVNKTSKTLVVDDVTEAKTAITTEINKLKAGVAATSKLSTYNSKLNTAKNTTGLTVNETSKTLTVTDSSAQDTISAETAKLTEAINAAKELTAYNTQLKTAKNTTGLTVNETNKTITVTTAEAAKEAVQTEINKLKDAVAGMEYINNFNTAISNASQIDGLTVKKGTAVTLTNETAANIKTKVNAQISKINNAITKQNNNNATFETQSNDIDYIFANYNKPGFSKESVVNFLKDSNGKINYGNIIELDITQSTKMTTNASSNVSTYNNWTGLTESQYVSRADRLPYVLKVGDTYKFENAGSLALETDEDGNLTNHTFDVIFTVNGFTAYDRSIQPLVVWQKNGVNGPITGFILTGGATSITWGIKIVEHGTNTEVKNKKVLFMGDDIDGIGSTNIEGTEYAASIIDKIPQQSIRIPNSTTLLSSNSKVTKINGDIYSGTNANNVEPRESAGQALFLINNSSFVLYWEESLFLNNTTTVPSTALDSNGFYSGTWRDTTFVKNQVNNNNLVRPLKAIAWKDPSGTPVRNTWAYLGIEGALLNLRSPQRKTTSVTVTPYEIQANVNAYDFKTNVNTYKLQTNVNDYTLQSKVNTYTLKSNVNTYSLQSNVNTYDLHSKVTTYDLQSNVNTYSLLSNVNSYALQTDVNTYSLQSDVITYDLQSSVNNYTLRSNVNNYQLQSTINDYELESNVKLYELEVDVIEYEFIQHGEIDFVDLDKGGSTSDYTPDSIITKDEIEGISLSEIDYNVNDTINRLTKQGYKLYLNYYDGTHYDNDVDILQGWNVYFKHNVKPDREDARFTRKIYYKYNSINGDDVTEPVFQTAEIDRKSYYDEVTGETTYSEWTTDVFESVDSPDIADWLPDRSSVESVIVTNGSEKEIIEYVIYKRIPQKGDVKFINEETGEEIADKVLLDGYNGDSISYSPIDTIKNLEEKGWDLVSNDFPTDPEFDRDPDTDQHWTVVLKPHVEIITYEDPKDPGSNIPGRSQVNYKDGLTYDDLRKDFTRNIYYKYETRDGDDVFDPVKENYFISRVAQFNYVTGAVKYITEWTTADVPAVDSPVKEHYYFDRETVPGTKLTVESTSPEDEYVIYKKIIEKGSVRFIDEDKNDLLDRDTFQGYDEDPFEYDPQEKIDYLFDDGWDVSSNGYPEENERFFDSNPEIDQDYEIIFTPHIEIITEENPKNPGDPTDRDRVNYPEGVDLDSLARDVIRIVKYVDKDGNEMAPPVEQKVHLTRTAKFNYVTKEVEYTPWDIKGVESVTSPVIDGYTADRLEVPEVESLTEDIEEIVVYTPNPQDPEEPTETPTEPTPEIPTDEEPPVVDTPEEIPPVDTPDYVPEVNTGDKNNIVLSSTAIGISAAGIIGAILGIKKKKKKDEEA